MLTCKDCKYSLLRDDETMFCNIILPPWIYTLLPDDKFVSGAQDVSSHDYCSFLEQHKYD